jgi:prepilin-type processing-associated H-X9-DG protein
MERPYEQSREAACRSNLKQLGLALKQYTQDYDDRFPWRVGVENPAEAWLDLGMLFPDYGSALRTFLCPSSRDRQFDPMASSGSKYDYPLEPFASTSTKEVISYSYGIDARTGTPTAWTEDAPSTVRLLADKKADILADERSNHKDDGRNVLYQDGHVGWRPGPAALDPGEDDETIGDPNATDYRRWWSDPPYYGR